MHFLAYAADPRLVHASFTIFVWRKDCRPSGIDLARMCRSASTVNKIHLLAEILDDEVEFTKLEWFGQKRFKKFFV